VGVSLDPASGSRSVSLYICQNHHHHKVPGAPWPPPPLVSRFGILLVDGLDISLRRTQLLQVQDVKSQNYMG